MRPKTYLVGLVGLVVLSVATWSLQAQQPNRTRPNRGRPSDNQPQGGAEATPNLPNDPRLVQIHKDFVQKAEQLAVEYEREKDLDKARVVYEQILKLVPGYPKAQEGLAKIRQQESTAERKVFTVMANKSWQDTGVIVVPGKPIHIEAAGDWTMTMSHDLDANGMEIPEELRSFNLGSLVGGIFTGGEDEFKPFFIGASYDLVSDKPGKLMVAMWDSDHKDNIGRLTLEIRGTFGK